jgi:hypothetical protein
MENRERRRDALSEIPVPADHSEAGIQPRPRFGDFLYRLPSLLKQGRLVAWRRRKCFLLPEITSVVTGPWFSPALVWGTWTILLIAALASISKYHHEVPICEDWAFVPYVTGEEPITAAWLWQQEYEHRIPLTRLIGVILLKIGGGDTWAMMLFRILAMGGLACATILLAKKIRGWTSVTDTFFPLVFLQWAASPHMLRGVIGICYPLPTYLAGVIFLIIVKSGTRLQLGAGVLAGICLLLLPLCGAMGLVYVPALTIWLGYSGVLSWRSREPNSKRNSVLILALAFAVLLIVAFYFDGYEKGTSNYPSNTSVRLIFKTSLAFLTESLGRLASTLWPYSGLPFFVLLVLSVGILLFMILFNQGSNRSRALALLFFGSAIATLAFGIGWGRGVYGPDAVWQYESLPVLILPWIYFVWVIYQPKRFRNFMQIGLFFSIAIVVPLNITLDFKLRTESYKAIIAFKQDIEHGMPPFALIARHQMSIGDAGYGDELLNWLPPLRRSKIGSFRYLEDNPPFREMSLRLEPRVHQAEWKDETIHGTGAESYMTFALPKPMFVAGVRIRGTHSNGPTANPSVHWGICGDSGFVQVGGAWCPGWPGDDFEKTFYVADTIDQIRIFPDNKPFQFSVTDLLVLIPDAKP